MAVVQAVSTLRMTSLTGGFRQWSCVARLAGSGTFGLAGGDYNAGALVNLDYAMTFGGTAPPDAPNNNIEVNVYIDAGATLVYSTSVVPGTATQTLPFYVTANGLVGGAARAGTLRIRLRMEKTNGGPLATYHVDTDGTNSTQIQSGALPIRDQGWLRGNTTATVAVSNISLGGGKTQPAEFGESVFHRVTTGATAYAAYTTLHTLTGTSKSGNLSSAGTTRDVTFSGTSISAGRVNEGFPAALATYTATVAATSVASLTGLAALLFTSTTPDTLQVDPRLTATHLFQLDDNSFGTPPLTKLDPSGERPSSSIAYMSTHFRTARGIISGTSITRGVAGLTATIRLTSAVNGDQITRVATSATEGGEVGWTAGFMQWTSPLPGGTWAKTVDITSPSDIDDDAYLLNSTVNYTLVASQSPFVTIIIDAGHANSDANDRHMHSGDPLEVGAFLEFTKLGEEKWLTFDAATTPQVAIKRLRGNRLEYWNGTAFVIANPVIGFLPMTRPDAAGAPYLWTYTTPTDANWSDVTCEVAGIYNGVSYNSAVSREFVGLYKRHDDPYVVNLLWIPLGDRGSHWLPGDPVIVSFSLFAPAGNPAPVFDAAPEVTVLRISASLSLEYLDSDLSWLPFVDLDSAYAWTMTSNSITFGDTSMFDDSDLLLVASAAVNGEPYGNLKVVEVVGGANRHARYAFDGAGFVGFPTH